MKKVILGVSTVISLFTVSCDKKKENITQPESSVVSSSHVESKMTLQEFAETRPSENERNYLLTTKPIDNSTDFATYISNKAISKTNAEIAKPKVKFKWHGLDPKGHGCETPLGICIILGGGGSADLAAIEVSAGIINNKFVIEFPNNINSNFGLTINGYLPLLFNVSIPSDIATELGITSPNPKIKAGIYQAYFDASQNRYTGIAINM